jgi:hypothetical protein
VGASAAGVAVLAGLVALASRRSAPWGAPAVDWPSIGGGKAVVAALALLMTLGVLVGLIRVLVRLRSPRLEVSPGRRSWLAALLTTLLLVLVLASIGHRASNRERSLLPAHQSVGSRPEPTRSSSHRSGPGLDTWLVAGIGGALAVALVAAGLVARTRRATPDDDLEEPPEPVAEEAGEVDLDALLADPDPRRAVIAAYAGMERTLARVGVGRRAPEAPLEYLGRLRAAGPALAPMADRLTALYQRARYGPGPISPAMRDDAIAALRALGEAAGA